MAKKVFHDTILYYKGTNHDVLENTTGSNDVSAGKFYKVKHWDPPPVGWLKWNNDASRIADKHATMISYVCRIMVVKFILLIGR